MGTHKILLQADLLVSRLGCVVTQQLGQLRSVGGILVDTQLQALSELFIELPWEGGGGERLYPKP